MEQFEKVCKGLECCSQMSGEACKKCPYANECEGGLLAGSAHLAANALSLIRQLQERIKVMEVLLDAQGVEVLFDAQGGR